MQVQSLCQENPLEKETVIHSIILDWRIPWTKKPGRLQSMGVSKSLTQLSTHIHNMDILVHSSCYNRIPQTVWLLTNRIQGIPKWCSGKNLPANAGDRRRGFDPQIGKISWSRKWQPFQERVQQEMKTLPGFLCLENLMHRGAWWATVHGVAKSQT